MVQPSSSSGIRSRPADSSAQSEFSSGIPMRLLSTSKRELSSKGIFADRASQRQYLHDMENCLGISHSLRACLVIAPEQCLDTVLTPVATNEQLHAAKCCQRYFPLLWACSASRKSSRASNSPAGNCDQPRVCGMFVLIAR